MKKKIVFLIFASAVSVVAGAVFLKRRKKSEDAAIADEPLEQYGI